MNSEDFRQVDSSIVENRESPGETNGSTMNEMMDTTRTEDPSSQYEAPPSLVTCSKPSEGRNEQAVPSKETQSDREDSPELVIVTHPDEPVSINNNNGGNMSGEEIDLSVPLEESSDEEQEHGSHLKYGSGHTNGGTEMQEESLSPGHKARQVGKLKRFFMTLQGFGNNLGSEVAEQVQELITALVVNALHCGKSTSSFDSYSEYGF